MNKLFQLILGLAVALGTAGCLATIHAGGGLAGVVYGKAVDVPNSSDLLVDVKLAGPRPLFPWQKNHWVTAEKGELLSIAIQNGTGSGASTALIFRAWKKDGTYLGVAPVNYIYVSSYGGNSAEVITITNEGVVYGGQLIRWITSLAPVASLSAPQQECCGAAFVSCSEKRVRYNASVCRDTTNGDR